MYKFLFSVIMMCLIVQPVNVFADDHGDLVSGVINAISVDEDGQLEGILLMTSDGQFLNIDIKSGENPTEYGLDNIAGERWTGNQNDDSKEVVLKPVSYTHLTLPTILLV